eukprot:gene17068-biopygen20338
MIVSGPRTSAMLPWTPSEQAGGRTGPARQNGRAGTPVLFCPRAETRGRKQKIQDLDPPVKATMWVAFVKFHTTRSRCAPGARIQQRKA